MNRETIDLQRKQIERRENIIAYVGYLVAILGLISLWLFLSR